jgi:hypothetical protein
LAPDLVENQQSVFRFELEVNHKYIGISSHTTQPIKYEDTNFEHLLETIWKKVNFLEL